MPPNDAFVIHCFAPVMCQPPSPRSARVQRAGVRARAGLGQREAADRLAARERRHEARALLVGAELEDRQRARGRVHRDRDADAGIRARELLEHQDVREEVGARAAVLLRHAHAQQPELAELAEQLAGKPCARSQADGVRLDLGLRELACERLDLALLGGELEVHGGQLSHEIAAAILTAVALAGCGGHNTRSPEQVARSWSADLDRNDNDAAAWLFADGANVVQDGELVLSRPRRRGAVERIAAVRRTDHLGRTPSGKTDVLVVFRLDGAPGPPVRRPGATPPPSSAFGTADRALAPDGRRPERRAARRLFGGVSRGSAPSSPCPWLFEPTSTSHVVLSPCCCV